ncbi:MAG: pantetheine-phosphate adenylyltransferase [Sphaerochaetaceae bacterium]|nr:pantetheine-phosphate adenylyltransferase [Sphaerochaetaceae bacterium]MDD3365641.1 pantetheine-phosphate adenylyltransferase [Sphaerochaetaceae bacterium]MDD4219223.1 pantetheine-phosphate adenylyltransferase [Sphaerochaetaceae bacterium]MDY0371192.1 pantetheine-phosphate adenylyltransferase [Sphaerochaetaceae bacterium]
MSTIRHPTIKAMLPGTFDPPTNGHLNIIERSARLFSQLDIVVADNISKKCLFSGEERMAMLREMLQAYPHVRVVAWDGLVADYAKKEGVDVMIRGVRALVDFGYEFELAMTNKQLNPDLEVLFMPTDPNYFVLRSSAIKEIAAFGADISTMVPKSVAEKLKSKLEAEKRNN